MRTSLKSDEQSLPPLELQIYDNIIFIPKSSGKIFNKMGIFSENIYKLPKADIPITGLEAYLSQGDEHQILFMEFQKDVEIPEHYHESQWGVVLEGKIELTVNGISQCYYKGDRYFIPNDILHSAKIYAGFTDITFFNQKDRYRIAK